MEKIKVKQPIVEMDGDEMTRVIWARIKEQLVLPYLDVDLKYYDLSVTNRDATDDKVTVEAAEATLEYGVAVKCATITPNEDRVTEFALKRQWPSPNGTIRGIMDGTVFRKPITLSNVPPKVKSWKRPITVARHAFGDIYRDQELVVQAPGTVELVYTPRDGGAAQRLMVNDFSGGGVAMGMFNTDASIRSFARACFTYALGERINIWFGTKDTISKRYHARFRVLFQEEADARRADLAAAGITYSYFLIDDAVAQTLKNEGGYLWACMNYDGDVMSDMVAEGFGSLGLMTSVLVNPDGKYEYEAAHGTVTRHFRRHQRGEETSTNSVASIFAWTGALARRGEIDGTPAVVDFARALEGAVTETIEGGTMTRDLLSLTTSPDPRGVNTFEFMDAVEQRLAARVGSK
ncbi:MAG TPA: NADP-dependent isocitrate dehydrogenase [Chloroflexota bacterium]|nr:NADP-dependent isocitrate dehydrogenase [Chloroflexota bacterium]